MGSSCIITDNAAQFTKIVFPESICLRFINYETEYFSQKPKDKSKPGQSPLPGQLSLADLPIITAPSNENIAEEITSGIKYFDDLYIILQLKELNPVHDTILSILSKNHGRAAVHLIDSQTLSIGQGHLVQYAAELIAQNTAGVLVEQQLREEIPHIYTLLCTPNLSFLHTSGFIDIGQCVVGEMLSLLPIFGIEEGKFNPLDKVKNIHSVIEYFISFIEEFESLYQVAFLHPTPSLFSESRIIKQYLEETFPRTLYSEHPLNSYLSSLIGPRGFGLVVIEK